MVGGFRPGSFQGRAHGPHAEVGRRCPARSSSSRSCSSSARRRSGVTRSCRDRVHGPSRPTRAVGPRAHTPPPPRRAQRREPADRPGPSSCGACSSTQSTALRAGDLSASVRITHPFHPQFGAEIDFVERRHLVVPPPRTYCIPT
jgi:hypothetical protein